MCTQPAVRMEESMANYVKPVVFLLGKEMYGVDINLVQSIEKDLNVVPVPNSQSYIKEVLEINDIDESHILPMPSMLVKADTQYLDRVANVDGKLILLLDVEKYADQYNND